MRHGADTAKFERPAVLEAECREQEGLWGPDLSNTQINYSSMEFTPNFWRDMGVLLCLWVEAPGSHGILQAGV